MTIAEFVLGWAIVSFALLDVFWTIMIPGPSKGPFRIGVRLRNLILPPWRYLSQRRTGGRRQRLSNFFAPFLRVNPPIAAWWSAGWVSWTR